MEGERKVLSLELVQHGDPHKSRNTCQTKPTERDKTFAPQLQKLAMQHIMGKSTKLCQGCCSRTNFEQTSENPNSWMLPKSNRVQARRRAQKSRISVRTPWRRAQQNFNNFCAGYFQSMQHFMGQVQTPTYSRRQIQMKMVTPSISELAKKICAGSQNTPTLPP